MKFGEWNLDERPLSAAEFRSGLLAQSTPGPLDASTMRLTPEGLAAGLGQRFGAQRWAKSALSSPLERPAYAPTAAPLEKPSPSDEELRKKQQRKQMLVQGLLSIGDMLGSSGSAQPVSIPDSVRAIINSGYGGSR